MISDVSEPQIWGRTFDAAVVVVVVIVVIDAVAVVICPSYIIVHDLWSQDRLP